MANDLIKISAELLEKISHLDDPSLAPFSKEIFLLKTVVAGTTHVDGIEELEPQLEKGTVLCLFRKEENRYDKCAIGVYLADKRLGWIPMEHNLIISRLMDSGKTCFCRVETKQFVKKWLKIEINVFMIS